MILRTLELENFGPFDDKHTFILYPISKANEKRPIIVIGGKNGTGKTTILEAIKLCLYGDALIGRRMSRSAYNYALRHKIHRSLDGRSNASASVAVEFDYARLGTVSRYRITRSWKEAKESIHESLEIRQDGKPITGIAAEQWQHFVIDLIPLSMTKLFFFDGEQVQSLAESETDDKYLMSSINSLLGLDLIEQLQADLRIYASRKTRTKDAKTEAQISEVQRTIEVLEEKLEAEAQEIAHTQVIAERVQAEIDQQEQQISREGGGFAKRREELKNKKRQLDQEIDSTKQKMREIYSNLFPFTLAKELCLKLGNRLREEEIDEQRMAALRLLDAALADVLHDLGGSSPFESLGISGEGNERLIDQIMAILHNKISSLKQLSRPIIHSVSPQERVRMLQWIEEAIRVIPLRLGELKPTLERLVVQRQEVETSLFRAPEDDVLSPFMEKLGILNQELGTLQEKQGGVEKQKQRTTYEIEVAQRELDKQLLQAKQTRRMTEKLALAAKVESVLQEYLDQARNDKTSLFAETLLECMNTLFEKKLLFREVRVDPKIFKIDLVNREKAIILKDELSAGEKQMYAISMLWALARTSGRPLPFIIDTPLGRLDTKHRQSIVDSFFPNASHQVIILSTDTEIDRRYFDRLQPFISRAYRLDYDSSEGQTRVSEGYFE